MLIKSAFCMFPNHVCLQSISQLSNLSFKTNHLAPVLASMWRENLRLRRTWNCMFYPSVHLIHMPLTKCSNNSYRGKNGKSLQREELIQCTREQMKSLQYSSFLNLTSTLWKMLFILHMWMLMLRFIESHVPAPKLSWRWSR